MSKLTHSTEGGMTAIDVHRWKNENPHVRIVSENICPPIPIRSFDWCAHFDDPEGVRGFGATEHDAIVDLIEQAESR